MRQIKTPATSDMPEIGWDELMHQLLSRDVDEREDVYECLGTGSDGNSYTGIATYSCDELVGITDIHSLIKHKKNEKHD